MRTPWAIVLALLLGGCGKEPVDDELTPLHSADIPREVPAQEALAAAHLPTLDPHTMNDAEVTKVLGEGSFCAFRYVSDGKPVLAWKQQPASAAPGVVKLNGLLVELAAQAGPDGLQFTADEIVMSLALQAPSQKGSYRPMEAKLVFQVGRELRVGYGGYTTCSVRRA